MILMFRKKRCPKSKDLDFPDHIISLDSTNFEDFICNYSLSVIDFYAPWCKPCRDIVPRLRRLSKLYRGAVAFGRIDIEGNKEIAKKYKISAIPYIALFSYGKLVDEIRGLTPIGEMKKKIERLIDNIER